MAAVYYVTTRVVIFYVNNVWPNFIPFVMPVKLKRVDTCRYDVGRTEHNKHTHRMNLVKNHPSQSVFMSFSTIWENSENAFITRKLSEHFKITKLIAMTTYLNNVHRSCLCR